MLRKLATISGLTLLSRVFGLVRDLMMAAVLGAGPVADAFMLAFRLPNHFRAIFAEGAFNTAFLPAYTATETREGGAAAARFRATVLAALVGANLVLLLPALVARDSVLDLLAPGLDPQDPSYDLAVRLTRITFPYLLCMSLVAYLSALLNARDRFAAAAAVPILLNLFLIGGLAWAGRFETAADAAAWSVAVAGVAQVLLLALAARRAGYRLSPVKPGLTTPVRVFLRRLVPAVLTSGALQVAILADTMIATFLPAGALSYLYYADRLYQLPVGVIGIALGTLLLPDIARRASLDDTDGMRRASDRALRLCIAVAAPVGVLLLFFGDWIMLLLFARGAFDAADAEASARVLAAYSIGMIPALAVRSLVAGFHGRGDLRTPFLLLLAATAVNVLLKVLLVDPLGIAGLALATAIGLWIYIGALYAVARRREYASSLGHRLALVTLPVLGLGALLNLACDRIRPNGADLADPLRLALSLGAVAGALFLSAGALLWLDGRFGRNCRS